MDCLKISNQHDSWQCSLLWLVLPSWLFPCFLHCSSYLCSPPGLPTLTLIFHVLHLFQESNSPWYHQYLGGRDCVPPLPHPLLLPFLSVSSLPRQVNTRELHANFSAPPLQLHWLLFAREVPPDWSGHKVGQHYVLSLALRGLFLLWKSLTVLWAVWDAVEFHA